MIHLLILIGGGFIFVLLVTKKNKEEYIQSLHKEHKSNVDFLNRQLENEKSKKNGILKTNDFIGPKEEGENEEEKRIRNERRRYGW